MIGKTITANEKHYEIVKLLGKGKAGYSYLATHNNNSYVVKQIHYEPCAYFKFEDNKLNSELRSYDILRSLGISIPKLLYHNQEEQYLIKEYISGDMLSELAANSIIKDDYITQVFAMCSILYKNNLNIDYFPTNFIVKDNIVYYIDYECSPYTDEWNFENWGIYFWANHKGMAKYLQTGDDADITKNGKPIKDGLDSTVLRWMHLRESLPKQNRFFTS